MVDKKEIIDEVFAWHKYWEGEKIGFAHVKEMIEKA